MLICSLDNILLNLTNSLQFFIDVHKDRLESDCTFITTFFVLLQDICVRFRDFGLITTIEGFSHLCSQVPEVKVSPTVNGVDWLKDVVRIFSDFSTSSSNS